MGEVIKDSFTAAEHQVSAYLLQKCWALFPIFPPAEFERYIFYAKEPVFQQLNLLSAFTHSEITLSENTISYVHADFINRTL